MISSWPPTLATSLTVPHAASIENRNRGANLNRIVALIFCEYDNILLLFYKSYVSLTYYIILCIFIDFLDFSLHTRQSFMTPARGWYTYIKYNIIINRRRKRYTGAVCFFFDKSMVSSKNLMYSWIFRSSYTSTFSIFEQRAPTLKCIP